jgi:hypothetical protein
METEQKTPDPFDVQVTFTLSKENVKSEDYEDHLRQYHAIMEYLRSQHVDGWKLKILSVVE